MSKDKHRYDDVRGNNGCHSKPSEYEIDALIHKTIIPVIKKDDSKEDDTK